MFINHFILLIMIHLIHMFLNQLTIFIFKGGRKKLKNEIIDSINSHMLSLSSIAANRYLKKIDKNAFYCSVSTVEAFLKFENADNISFSTFYLSFWRSIVIPIRPIDFFFVVKIEWEWDFREIFLKPFYGQLKAFCLVYQY